MDNPTFFIIVMLLIGEGYASELVSYNYTSSANPSSSTSPVQWTSPAAGDTFGPGDPIPIRWKAPDKTISPSFRVCEGSGDKCGATIWPQVEQSGNNYATTVWVFALIDIWQNGH